MAQRTVEDAGNGVGPFAAWIKVVAERLGAAVQPDVVAVRCVVAQFEKADAHFGVAVRVVAHMR